VPLASQQHAYTSRRSDFAGSDQQLEQSQTRGTMHKVQHKVWKREDDAAASQGQQNAGSHAPVATAAAGPAAATQAGHGQTQQQLLNPNQKRPREQEHAGTEAAGATSEALNAPHAKRLHQQNGTGGLGGMWGLRYCYTTAAWCSPP
jgi:hypothetical protein